MPNSGSFFHSQPPSLPILLSEAGSKRKVLTKETWFSLARRWKSWWTFQIFFIFFLLGEGEGGVWGARRGGGGGLVFYWKSQGGGFEEGEGPGARLRRIGDFSGVVGGGGGLNIFFRGRNVHQVKVLEIAAGVAIIRPPYKIQNPSEPQNNTPRNTPEIPLQNRNTEKILKIYQNHPISRAVFAPTRFSYVRISIRDMVADRNP